MPRTRIYYATVPAQTDTEREAHPSTLEGPNEVHLLEPVKTYEWAEYLPERYDERTPKSLGLEPEFCCDELAKLFRRENTEYPREEQFRFFDGTPPSVRMLTGGHEYNNTFHDQYGPWRPISFCPWCGGSIECVPHLTLKRHAAKVVVEKPSEYDVDVLEVDG